MEEAKAQLAPLQQTQLELQKEQLRVKSRDKCVWKKKKFNNLQDFQGKEDSLQKNAPRSRACHSTTGQNVSKSVNGICVHLHAHTTHVQHGSNV